MKKFIDSKLFTTIAVLAIAMMFFLTRLVWGWTSPTGAPPTGGGALYYSGGNVGIGTTGPGNKLAVNGNIQTLGGNGLILGDQTANYSNSIQFVSWAVI